MIGSSLLKSPPKGIGNLVAAEWLSVSATGLLKRNRTMTIRSIYNEIVASLTKGGYKHVVVPFEAITDRSDGHNRLAVRLMRAAVARIAYLRGFSALDLVNELQFSGRADFYRQIKRFGCHATPPKWANLAAVWEAIQKAVYECGGE